MATTSPSTDAPTCPLNRLLLKNELAEYLQVSTRTIEHLRRRGLPAVLVGKAVRFRLDKVLSWLEARPAGPARRTPELAERPPPSQRRGRPRNIDRGRPADRDFEGQGAPSPRETPTNSSSGDTVSAVGGLGRHKRNIDLGTG